LEKAAALDQQGARGLLADITTASTLKRQTAFAILATHQPDEVGGFLNRIGEDHFVHAVRARKARELLKAAFDRPHIPAGYLRALERIGTDPLQKPEHYARLLEIYTNPVEVRKANALRYCGFMSSTKVEVVDILDPVLLDPQIVADLHDASTAHQLNGLLRFIRQICSSASDEEIAATFRGCAGRWRSVAQHWLAMADSFPEPPFRSASGLRPITSAQEMVEIGASMKNCLATKVGEVLLGLAFYYVTELEAAGRGLTPVIVEIVPISNGGWVIAGVHGPRHRSVPLEIVHRVLQPLLDQGALVYATTRPQAQALADVIGVTRWGEFRLPVEGHLGEEESTTEFEDLDSLLT
jgi:hypothetical protein